MPYGSLLLILFNVVTARYTQDVAKLIPVSMLLLSENMKSITALIQAKLRPPLPRPLGRWQVGGNWEHRADMATRDSGTHVETFASTRALRKEESAFVWWPPRPGGVVCSTSLSVKTRLGPLPALARPSE